MSGANPAQILLLYRRILKAAARFPSVKRDGVIADIKTQFREHKGLANAAKINHELAVALRSLEQLEAYAGMSRSSPELDISLKGSCD
ncbi:Complex 1 LYR [Micractinium conductrix]|uniref:Complex 1 LYR n=1 Tax=Micractinium conductrix TaxID=554055 RepID=A0A2P6VGZ1_9CHLO|nr:Complex 1 LYR [Micractinium conductrix]|eukprot:PSC73355.1 Complex 1 LYR [Micractinium conductrix]